MNYTVNLTYYSDRIVCVKESTLPSGNRDRKKEVMLENRSTVYNGYLSPSAKRKVRQIITSWMSALHEQSSEISRGYNGSKRKPTFVTLTLSETQKHDDNYIKRHMLNRFLQVMQRNYSVKYFFWRAEKQKNGNIHFHLILDSYLPYKSIQNEWNKIQDSYDYIEKYSKKKGHKNPPSTHIEKIDNATKAVEYVMKYVSKNPDNLEDEKLKVNGRIWGCSKELKDLKPYNTAENSDILAALFELQKNRMCHYVKDEFFEVYFVDTHDFLSSYFPSELKNAESYYKTMSNHLYSNTLPLSVTEDCIKEIVEEVSPPPVQLSLFPELSQLSSQHQREKEFEEH